MKCKTHGNHCCAICVLEDLNRNKISRPIENQQLIAGIFFLAAFIVGVGIYY